MARDGMIGRVRSVRAQIQIGKKQSKNRMVGQTFNPSGITSEQMREREGKFLAEMKAKTLLERQQYWGGVQEVLKMWKENNIRCSWCWEWCAFKRGFVGCLKGEVN